MHHIYNIKIIVLIIIVIFIVLFLFIKRDLMKLNNDEKIKRLEAIIKEGELILPKELINNNFINANEALSNWLKKVNDLINDNFDEIPLEFQKIRNIVTNLITNFNTNSISISTHFKNEGPHEILNLLNQIKQNWTDSSLRSE